MVPAVPRIIAVHNMQDKLSHWSEAEKILDSLDVGRAAAQYELVQRVILDRKPGKKKDRSGHAYWDKAIKELVKEMETAASSPACGSSSHAGAGEAYGSGGWSTGGGGQKEPWRSTHQWQSKWGGRGSQNPIGAGPNWPQKTQRWKTWKPSDGSEQAWQGQAT